MKAVTDVVLPALTVGLWAFIFMYVIGSEVVALPIGLVAGTIWAVEAYNEFDNSIN
jgi:hypothetical protein